MDYRKQYQHNSRRDVQNYLIMDLESKYMLHLHRNYMVKHKRYKYDMYNHFPVQ